MVWLGKVHKLRQRLRTIMNAPQSYGIKATLKLLEETRNDAAIAVLAHGLAVSDPKIREASVRALLARRTDSAIKAIVQHWHTLDAGDKKLLDNHWQLFVPNTLAMLKSQDTRENRNAIQTVADLNLVEGFFELIQISINDTHLLCTEARQALTQLASRWGERARSGRDVPSVRIPMLQSLFSSIYEYQQHRCVEVIDAWLRMSAWEDATLRTVLLDPGHPCYTQIMRRLRFSQEPQIIELLAGFLTRRSTPQVILEVLAQRQESFLAFHLIEKYQNQFDEVSRYHFERMPRCECLFIFNTDELAHMSFSQQQTLAMLRAANASSPHTVLQAAIDIERSDPVEGPKSAARLLRLLHGISLEVLCSAFGNQPSEPERDLRGLIESVLHWRDHNNRHLAESTSKIFEEISLNRLLAQIPIGPASLCEGIANLLKVLGFSYENELTLEIGNPSPRRRSLAIRAIAYLGLVPTYRTTLGTLISDSREEVRVAAIESLATDPSIEATRLLLLAQNFPSSITNEAALLALRDRTIPEAELVRDSNHLPPLSESLLIVANSAEPLAM
jgi:hypothetical protein